MWRHQSQDHLTRNTQFPIGRKVVNLVNLNHHLSCTVAEIWSLENFGVMTFTFWSNVTSPVTWPLDSRVVYYTHTHTRACNHTHKHCFRPLDWRHVVSYRWAIQTNRISHTVFEIWSLKYFGVMILTFWGHLTIGLATCGFL